MTQPRPRRLLAVDPGSRRVGIAVSDELGMFAFARPALPGGDTVKVADSIATIVAAEQIDEVVVGMPISLSGADTAQTTSVRAFVAELRRRLTVPVSVWDERLSSVQAGRSVKGADRRKSGELDSAAAAIVLQAVLESRRPGTGS
ncbi:MAG TPA: Holliday junction resolvase RuvX [Tepidiformaceae bacterium]|jgi:putative Holliday junction resolvase